jgi:murein DD-endopeptidase MepM/ murein hydrolase activator NlpD
MIRFSIHLPINHRLDIKLVKSRGCLRETPIIPPLDAVINTRTGNKISRFFRHIFEHKKFKKLLGKNLALAIFAASLLDTRPVFGQLLSNPEIIPPVVISTEKGAQFPVENISITQRYNIFHPGIDLDGETGDPVVPILRGRVISIENSKFAYGKSIVISHGNGITSRYAHLSKILVREGQEVTKTTKIGEVGSTGRSSGDHLHLEVYEHGKPIDPLRILSQ